jgi:hypothetical protein
VKAQVLDRHGVAIQLLVLFEADIRILAGGGLDLLDLDLLEQLLARGRLPRLGGIRLEAAHEFLQV